MDDPLIAAVSETSTLVAPTIVYRTYASRWWIMLVTSIFAGLQGGIWAAFGPIAPALSNDDGTGLWDYDGFVGIDFTCALLAGWGPVVYLITAWPFMWSMERWGLRIPTIFASALIFVGSMCKVFTATGAAAVYLSHVGQILNAAAGPVAMGIGPVVSAAWFAPGERTFSTSVIAMANTLGVAIMFIVGPYMVPSDASKEQLLYFWYVWAAATGIILLASIVYLPSQPPSPPSRSASTTRTDFAGGFRAILSCTRKGSKEDNTPARARGFWLITAAYGIVTGVYGGWGSILALNCENFKQLDHPEVTAGWLGFWSTLAGCVGGVGFALYIDRGAVAARKKWLLLVLSILSGACFLVFSLMVSTDFIAFRPWLLYATNIVGGLLVNGQIPLFYEAGVEVM